MTMELSADVGVMPFVGPLSSGSDGSNVKSTSYALERPFKA